MVGQTPAPWFLEVNGQKQGPYTSEQIMKLLMDGALKVESRIFDTAANTWKLAADVIPYLDLNAPARPGARKSWAPPPRPTELKDVHIVDLNAEVTGEVDYFALINEQRQASARSEAAARLASRAQQSRAAARAAEEERARQSARKAEREAHNAARRAEPAKVVRVQPSVETPVAAAIAASPADDALVPMSGKDGILVAEVEPSVGFGLDNVILLGRRARKYMRSHKSAFAVAASLTFVFAGTYGTVRLLSDRKDRAPANVAENQAPTTPALAATAPSLGAASSDDSLGHGRNPVHRPHGTKLTTTAAARVVPAMPQQQSAGANTNSEAPRDPPQFYSSAEDQGQAAANPQTPPVAAGNVFNGGFPNNDPNSGVVNPPNFAPPPVDPNVANGNVQNDPNQNPNQY